MFLSWTRTFYQIVGGPKSMFGRLRPPKLLPICTDAYALKTIENELKNVNFFNKSFNFSVKNLKITIIFIFYIITRNSFISN